MTDEELAEWLNKFKLTAIAADRVDAGFKSLGDLHWLKSTYRPQKE